MCAAPEYLSEILDFTPREILEDLQNWCSDFPNDPTGWEQWRDAELISIPFGEMQSEEKVRIQCIVTSIRSWIRLRGEIE